MEKKNNNHQTNKYIEWLEFWDMLTVISVILCRCSWLHNWLKYLLKMHTNETFKRTRNNTFLETLIQLDLKYIIHASIVENI